MSAARPVYVFGEQPTPTYHRFGKMKDGTLRTACGQVVLRLNGDRYWQHYATRLRTDWAEQIGKPCAKCYRSRP